MTSEHTEYLDQSVRFIREHVSSTPSIALILGSGLGDYADSLPNQTVLPTKDIPHYPVSTVEGHKGRLVFSVMGGKNLLAFQGRIHFYESNDFEKVLFPIRVARKLGASVLIVTNAAGAVNRQFSPGDLMLITDQIDLTLDSTSREHHQIWHKPFYDKAFIESAEKLSAAKNVLLRRGVYAGMKGPSYETAAEVEMVHRLGGDAVGMSTVKEVALASELGMRVLGISCITNKGTGIGGTKLDHAEVTEVANRVRRAFGVLITDLIHTI